MQKYELSALIEDFAEDEEFYLASDSDARIAELEREITAITAQRDRVWSQLLDAREQIQRLTFGHSGN